MDMGIVRMTWSLQATRKNGPGERHLYTVTDFESGRPGVVTCISCDVLNTRGGACGFNSFEFREAIQQTLGI